MTADDTREALRTLIADWRSVPRNGYDEEGRVRHDIEVDCADAVEDALAAARRDPEPVASGWREASKAMLADEGFDEPVALPDPTYDLPSRIVVGKNGAYWRDYGDHYSMVPVSIDNDPVEPIGPYYQLVRPEDWFPEAEAAAQAAIRDPEPVASALHGHDVPGVGYLWFDADGKVAGGPEDD